MESLNAVVTGVVSAVISVFAIWVLFRPRIQFRDTILGQRYETAPTRYKVRYKNARLLSIYGVQVRVTIVFRAMPTRTTQVPVPLSTSDLPMLKYARDKKDFQTPRMLLDQIDWASWLPPGFDAPAHPLDLKQTLAQLQGHVVVNVTSTAAIFQVTANHQRVYDPEHVLVTHQAISQTPASEGL